MIKGQNILPLIVVYTNATNQELITKMENEIKIRFPNIPFIPTLAEKVEGLLNRFGLDVLIRKTTEVCKNAVKGDVFYAIKDKISKEITKNFTERNKKIKKDVNRLIIDNFINQKYLFKDNLFINYIVDLMKIIFVGYLKNTICEIRELKTGTINDLKNSDSIFKPIEEYIKLYKNNANNFIKPILSEKAIYYLDEQAKKEKYQFKKNMYIGNKNNKESFMEIIKTFLNSNFYCISQKYIIYHFITEVREPLSEKIENSFNKIVEDFLLTSKVDDLSKDFYCRKMDDLIKIINDYLKVEGYEEKNNNYKNYNRQRYSILNKRTNNNNNNVVDYDCPKGPCPNID